MEFVCVINVNILNSPNKYLFIQYVEGTTLSVLIPFSSCSVDIALASVTYITTTERISCQIQIHNHLLDVSLF